MEDCCGENTDIELCEKCFNYNCEMRMVCPSLFDTTLYEFLVEQQEAFGWMEPSQRLVDGVDDSVWESRPELGHPMHITIRDGAIPSD